MPKQRLYKQGWIHVEGRGVGTPMKKRKNNDNNYYLYHICTPAVKIIHKMSVPIKFVQASPLVYNHVVTCKHKTG
jgi:hypothetical protein